MHTAPRSGWFPSGCCGEPLSEVKNTTVFVARRGSARIAPMTAPSAMSMSCVASPTGPRADLPHVAALHESGPWVVEGEVQQEGVAGGGGVGHEGGGGSRVAGGEGEQACWLADYGAVGEERERRRPLDVLGGVAGGGAVGARAGDAVVPPADAHVLAEGDPVIRLEPAVGRKELGALSEMPSVREQATPS